ncbi:ATP-binding protein [Pseudobacteriovorax antillogorgiicola]|uniref:Sensory/regulatory protein RpfC n=1 Tax=Pseudobacteriovorax antillogorgiicola TaxID=1513793 RepID=A0A1Y6CBU8_9BACT|nr:ATP-binding protein [Pseudobacteriovorax antillogorgiicola]TCS48658.1 signal transduction histidine kinase [Pseudobacteriovorax antillogorgiicola]SMF55116.1 Signal transduction histidine kinase [Pseudobacteriovorax antillogorgiicola]
MLMSAVGYFMSYQSEQFQEVFSLNPYPTIIVGYNGIILGSNPSAQEIMKVWGCQQGDRAPDSLKDKIEVMISCQERQSVNLKIGRKTFNFELVPFHRSRAIYIYGMETTESDAARIALDYETASRQYMESVFNTISDLVFIINKEGFIKRINRSVEEFFRIDGNLAFGNEVYNLLKFEEDLTKSEFYEKALVNDKKASYWEASIFSYEWMQYVPFLFSSFKLESSDGDIVLLARNISERRRHTLAVEKARAKAEKANEMKSTFLANMSHEIRTPLNCIIGMTSVLQDESMTEEHHRYVNSIHSSSQSLLALVNDILDISRIEAGEITLELSEFSLNDIIEDMKSIFVQQALAKNIRFAVESSSCEVDHVLGDAFRLKQVLINIIGNAMKFTEEGSIRLLIGSHQRDDGKWLVNFSVRDTGIGIKPEDQDRLFQRFGQGDSSSIRKYGGTGLGLAICKHLCELMGGRIQVQSELGKGSEFSFVIVVEETSHTTLQAVGDPRPAVCHKDVEWQKYRVLVAEDNTANQELLKVIFKSFSLSFEIANDGQEAIDALERESFDLICMDCQMPNMGGIEATRIIRSHETWANIPILAMTANATRQSISECYAAGMNDYLAKPMDKTQIQNLLTRWLNSVEVCDIEHQVGQESSLKNGQESEVESSVLDIIRTLDASEDKVLETINETMIKSLMAYGEQFLVSQLYNFNLALSKFESDLKKNGDSPSDLIALQKHSHKFRTNCGIIGAEKMDQICSRIENCEHVDELSNLREDFQAESDKLRGSLRELITL